jgi:prepilin-type processing-associated H-X9-DG protein
MANVTDGLSKTVAFSEAAVANSSNNIRGSLAVGWVGSSAGPGDTIPANCLAMKGPNNTLLGSTNNDMSGRRWSDGVAAFAMVYTVLPPNAPSCTAGNDFDWVMATASSYHPSGVNVAMGDGSVRFVNDNVDCGNLGLPPVDGGYSPYGVWGGMGSMNGGESVSDLQ